MEYHTQRLTLKSFSLMDAEEALDILTNSHIGKTYMLPEYAHREDALPLFRRLMELSMDENRYVRGIYLDTKLIGFLNDVEILGTAIELGYVIHPEHQGKGYMTEALRGAVSELFHLGYQEVMAGAFEHNAASIRVMEKAGMQQIEKTDEIEYRGESHRCVYHSIKRASSLD